MNEALIFVGGVIAGLSIALGLIWNARREVARMIADLEAERDRLGVQRDGADETITLTEWDRGERTREGE